MLGRGRDHGGIEIDALHARRAEQPRIDLVERVHLALHEAAHRFRHRAREQVEFLGEDPLAVLLPQHLAPPQVAQQIDHEERMPLGPLVNHPGKTAGKAWSGNWSAR